MVNHSKDSFNYNKVGVDKKYSDPLHSHTVEIAVILTTTGIVKIKVPRRTPLLFRLCLYGLIYIPEYPCLHIVASSNQINCSIQVDWIQRGFFNRENQTPGNVIVC
jgi:hypothetical protein